MVLVTGGTGFIGSYIIKNLVEKGLEVSALRRSAKLPFYIPPSVFEKVRWIDGEVLDMTSLMDAMSGAEHVIHSAAVVSFHRNSRRLMYQVNIEGTANVVNAALENGIRRFVHVSSVSALGRTVKARTVDENKRWEENRNTTHYARSKFLSELQVWRGFAEGLEGVIVNPSTVLGFGDWHQSSCAIFRNIYRGFPWYTRGMNGFTGVEDVAEATVRLLGTDIRDRRFILNSENLAFRDLFNMIADAFGKPRPRREATRLMGEIAWRLESLKSMLTGRRALLTRETARVAHSMTCFDSSAIREALPGFEFTPLKDVISHACGQYKQALGSGQIII